MENWFTLWDCWSGVPLIHARTEFHTHGSQAMTSGNSYSKGTAGLTNWGPGQCYYVNMENRVSLTSAERYCNLLGGTTLAFSSATKNIFDALVTSPPFESPYTDNKAVRAASGLQSFTRADGSWGIMNYRGQGGFLSILLHFPWGYPFALYTNCKRENWHIELWTAFVDHVC